MSRIYKLYLEDILDCCENIREYKSGMSFEEFSADKKTIDAVVRNLEIIGEAVKSVPNEILQSKPEIEWKKISRFRDLIVHHYFKVDLEIVWDILENHLKNLEISVNELSTDLDQEL